MFFRTFANLPCLVGVVKIAQISDLHFGSTDPAAVAALSAALEAEKPDLTVISGDVTQAGRKSEFKAAAAFLRSLSGRVLSVPGNHDAPVHNVVRRFASPWSRFEQYIGAVETASVFAGGVAVIGVNSARRAALRLNWSYGQLSRNTIAETCALAVTHRSQGRMVMVACHHPFVVGPNRAGAEIVGRGEEALRAFRDAGVSAVATGHVHVSSAGPIGAVGNEILSVQAGSAASDRQRGEAASFNIIRAETDPERIVVKVMGLVNDHFQSVRWSIFERRDGAWCEAR
jgi:3',5'-cyclic AMP phosphodiesterase CpdA